MKKIKYLLYILLLSSCFYQSISVFALSAQSSATSGSQQYSNGGPSRNASDQLMNDTLNAAATKMGITPAADGTYSAADVTKIQQACGVPADGKWGGTSAGGNCASKVPAAVTPPVPTATSTTGGGGSETSDTKVVVTEKIPGMDCKSVGTDETLENRKYECTIKKGFGSVMDLLAWLIKYITLIAILVSVLMLVISGIRMSLEGKKDEAKKLFGRIIVSIIVLFMMGFILNTIAPWVFV